MKKEINTLNAIISKDEELLWHGKVSQKVLLIIIGKLLGFLTLAVLGLCISLCINIFFFRFYSELGFIIFIVVSYIVVLGFLVPFLFNLSNFGELRNLEYYVTDKQEFGVKGEKITLHAIYYNVYQRLKLDDIERIEITPLRFFSLVHIDFYSNFIEEHSDDFYFGIRKLEDKVIITNGNIEYIGGKKEKIFEKIKPELC